MKKIAAVDLFCGAGGLTHGLIKSGVKVIACFDTDENCRFAYEANNKGAVFYNKNVSKLSGKEVSKLFPKGHLKLLAGCAPCQPFSTYFNGKNAKSDEKWPLLYSFARLIREIKPDFVTMENVPSVTKHDVYHDFVSELKKLNYTIQAGNIFCPEYNIPQSRRRHVLLASRIGEIKMIQPIKKDGNYKTVRDAIFHLPPIKSGESHLHDSLHTCARLSEINLKRIKKSKPGGNWNDWPKNLIAKCHLKASGKTYGNVYARMEWDKPSPTITTQSCGFGNGRFGHPKQHRAISLRESAILQTFPKSYKFVKPNEPIKITAVGRMIGNAVPVQLGKAIGKSVINSSSNISTSAIKVF